MLLSVIYNSGLINILTHTYVILVNYYTYT